MATDVIQIGPMLDLIYTCDLIILHDGVDSRTFHTKENHLPTKVLFHETFNKNIGLGNLVFPSIDVAKSRFAPCRVAIFLLKFFTSLNSEPINPFGLEPWIVLLNEKNFYYVSTEISHRVHLPARNVFAVVVLHLEKGEGSKLLLWAQYWFGAKIYNFAIAHVSPGGGLTRLCVKRQHGDDIAPRNLNCCDKIENLVQTFTELSTPPKYWVFRANDFELERDSFTLNINLINAINPFNPFNRSLNYTVEHLAQAVFHKANATFIVRSGLKPRFGKVSLQEIKRYHYYLTVLTLKFVGFQFLTCYYEPYLSFRFYADPFQPDLWIGLLICICVITIIVSTYVHYSKLENVTFSPWLYVLSSLVEESYTVPTAIDKFAIFRYIFGLWSLMSVVLTNC